MVRGGRRQAFRVEIGEALQPVIFFGGRAGERRPEEPRLAQMQGAELHVALARFSCRGAIGTVELGARAGDMIVARLVVRMLLIDPHGPVRWLMQDWPSAKMRQVRDAAGARA